MMTALDNMFPRSVLPTECGRAVSFEQVGSRETASGPGGEPGVTSDARPLQSLSQKLSPMTENSSATAEKQVFSADAISREMQAHMRTLAMPCVPGEGVRVAITRAGRRIGVPYGQAKRLWYGEMQTIPAQLADRIRQTAARHQMGPDPEIQSEMAGIRNLLEQILAKLDEEQAAEKPA